MLPREAFTEVHGFEAKKDRLIQNQDGLFKITLTIQADDLPEWLIKAAPGQRLAIGLKALDEQVHEDVPGVSGRVRSGAHNQYGERVARAGLLCRQPLFQRFLESVYSLPADDPGLYPQAGNERCLRPEDQAAIRLRRVLKVDSRAQLAENAAAQERLDGLIVEFETWVKANPGGPATRS